jgi:hypothetical protein
MKRDFTLHTFRRLLEAILAGKYVVQTFADFLQASKPRVVVLRHDVDKQPGNALDTANIENDLGIQASYYFRKARESFDEKVIKKITGMGHEIGYHYEDIFTAKGDCKKAVKAFERNLERFRELYPVKTVCMHGSPLSKWDNRQLWQTHDYRDYGIIGEPYYDVDFNQVLYLTDTGRRWNGEKIRIWDRVESNFSFNSRTTFDLIESLENNQLPGQIMINIHPQRWNNAYFPWGTQLLLQNTKNILKKMIVMRNEKIQDHK